MLNLSYNIANTAVLDVQNFIYMYIVFFFVSTHLYQLSEIFSGYSRFTEEPFLEIYSDIFHWKYMSLRKSL